MKKSIYSVAAALAVGLIASCGVSAPKANLEGASKIDSLSYAIGMAQTQGLKDYLVARMGMDTTYMNQFVGGMLEAADADEKQNAYYSGTQIGQQVVNQIIPGVSMQVFAGKEGELNKKKFTEAFLAGVTEKGMKMSPMEAQETAMTLMRTIQENNDSTADLTAQIDTFSYAMGLAQTQGLKDFLVYRMGVDTLYMGNFVKGLKEGIKAGDDKKEVAFFTGVQIGQQVATQIIPGITRDVFGESGELNKNNFMAGFVDGVIEKSSQMSPMEAQEVAMRLMEELKNQRFEEEFGANKAEGVAFLDSIAKTDGVVKTASGLCYKIITEGKGAVPTSTDRVKVHYRGTLIDGTEFDSSYKRGEPTTFGANQVIAGWTEALTLMPVGSKWVLYIPQELAYGSRDMGQIKPFSTLVFEVELLEIEK